MSILSRLFGGEKIESAPVIAEKPTANLVRQVWSAPAEYNRETRRRVRLFGRIWRWDLNASEETRRTYVPRYIRRHYAASLVGPNTRRRRHRRARILAITRAKGLI